MGFPYVTYIYGKHGGAFQRLAVLIMMARYRIGLIIRDPLVDLASEDH